MRNATAPKLGEKQKTLVVISQVYVPDPAAVGQHMADMAEAMVARGWRVIVYTSGRGYDDPSVKYPSRERQAGVEIRRLPLSSFGKGSLVIRLIAQALFAIQATTRALFIRRIDTIVASTSPPFAGFFGALLSLVRRRQLLWWVMDLNPDQLVLAGALRERSLPVRCFDFLNRFTMRQSSVIVALDRFMRARLLRKVDAAEKIHIIPPWPHDHVLQPVAAHKSVFRAAHFSQAERLVMYSGNHGISTPVGPLVEAARNLAGNARLHFAFVGGGVLKPQIDRDIRHHALENATSLPYQPFDRLLDSLAAADVHVVSITNAAVGACHSCKIYNAMLLGRPILALAPPQSHVADIVNEAAAGWIVPPDDITLLTETLRTIAAAAGSDLQELGARGQEFVERCFRRDRLLGAFCDLIEQGGIPETPKLSERPPNGPPATAQAEITVANPTAMAP
jgi:colanic acid biosynthesis glycosyl transferase WcaI